MKIRQHIYEEGELEENSVVRKFRTTASDGEQYSVTHSTHGEPDEASTCRVFRQVLTEGQTGRERDSVLQPGYDHLTRIPY